MAFDINALREQKAALHAEATAIHDVAESNDRQMSEEEQATFDGKLASCDSLQTRIADAERLGASGDDFDASAGRVAAGTTRAIDDPGVKPDEIGGVRDRIEDDPKLGFKSLGDFAGSVRGMATGVIDARIANMEKMAAITGMGTVKGGDGGFLLPPSFSTDIWDGLNTGSESLLSMTDNFTIPSGTDSLTLNASAETSRATGSRYGGVRGYWLSEGDQMTSSKPTLRQIKLEPHTLAVLTYATDKLLNNAVALNQWITRAATDEIEFLVGDAIFNGDGAGKPKGILTGTAETQSPRIEVAKQGSQVAATIVYQNILKMWSRMHRRARANSAWFVNQDIEPELHSIEFPVGTGGKPAMLPPGGLSESPYATLLGRPVIPVEYCATLGTVGDIILADMKYYATGTRGGVESAMSIHLRFDYNESVFRWLFEIDGTTLMQKSQTPFKGTATQSPFVTLATRA